MRYIYLILVLFAVSGVVVAQEDETEDPNEGLPAGVSITIDDPDAGIELEVAEELHLNPGDLEAEIPSDGSTATLNVVVASRVSTEIEVRANNTDLMIAGDTFVTIRAGGRASVSFTAFSAHSGTIEFVNTEGDVVETLNYVVTEGKSYRQRVSASVNSSGNTSARYGINFDEGYGFNVNVSRDEDGEFSGGISGSYTW